MWGRALGGEAASPPRWLDGWFSVAWPTAAVTALASVLLLFFTLPDPIPSAGAPDTSDPLGVLVVDDSTADPLAGEVLALEAEE